MIQGHGEDMTPPDKKIKILVTGFEPFGGPVNISGDIVNQLRNTHPDVELVTRILPVNYQKAQAELKKLIQDEKPDFVLSLGEGYFAEIPRIGVETVAHSNAETLFNNKPQSGQVVRLTSNNPLLTQQTQQSVQKHFEKDALVETSKNAGSYVCEQAFYTALKEQARNGRKGQAMFLHISDLPMYVAKDKIAEEEATATELGEYFAQATSKDAPPAPAEDAPASTEETPASTEEGPAPTADFTPEERARYDTMRATLVQQYAKVVNDLVNYIGDHPDAYMQGAQYAKQTRYYPERKEPAVDTGRMADSGQTQPAAEPSLFQFLDGMRSWQKYQQAPFALEEGEWLVAPPTPPRTRSTEPDIKK